MALIVNSALAGFTAAYNSVQFGGADATYKSLPPRYSFEGQERWDESNRAVMWMDYTLNVSCVFCEDSEFTMAANMQAIRSLLLVPGKTLVISGLGTGFGTITLTGGTYFDINNGPRPGPVSCTPIGNLCWELNWSVSFSISECVSPGTTALSFAAFNFSTTWANDFEGLTTRTIAGHVVIAQRRNSISPKTVLNVAEETRGSIVALIPTGFQRTQNAWTETTDKSRLNFTIVDEQIGGDFLPPGITAGDGSFAFSAGDGKGGFANAIGVLSVSLKTAIDQPKNLAGQIFLAAAISKQAAMAASFTAQGVTNATIIPLKLSIVNGKFNRARQTDCSIVWGITSCLNAMLTAAGIWEPISTNDYTLWKASMAELWGNRGSTGIGSSAAEAVIIDLCDNLSSKTIGATTISRSSPANSSLDSLTCPIIPADGGWITFDLEIRVLRKDNQTQHRKAATYSPTVGQIFGSDPADADSVALGGSSYTQSSSDNHVTENHGFPETYIGLKFKGLRFKNKPYTPEIQSVGGMSARLVKQDPGTPKWAFDSFGCPVWYITGWRIYSVPGYVASVKAVGSKSSCGASTVPTTY